MGSGHRATLESRELLMSYCGITLGYSVIAVTLSYSELRELLSSETLTHIPAGQSLGSYSLVGSNFFKK